MATKHTVTEDKAREALGISELLEKREADLETLVGQINDINQQISAAQAKVAEMTAQANAMSGAIMQLKELNGEVENVDTGE